MDLLAREAGDRFISLHQARHKQLRASLLAMEGLYETGQHRLHLIDLSLLARYDLTAKFLDFWILDGRPLTHENSRCMMWDHLFKIE